jgi:HEAT repeat protein
MHKRTGAFWCILAVAAVGLIVLLIPSWRNAVVEFFQPSGDEPLYRGKPASYWAAAIKKGSPDAIELLDRCPADAIPAMMELARYEDATVHNYATCILTRAEPGDQAVLAVFLEALRREDAQGRLLALQGLGGMILAWQGGPATAVLSPLAVVSETKMAEGNAPARASARGENWHPDVVAVPALIQAVKDGDTKVRQEAIRQLALIAPMARGHDFEPWVQVAEPRHLAVTGPVARSAASALAASLNDGEEPIRVAAAFALGRMGKDARPALPALLAALRDPARQVRDHASGALWHFPDEIAEGLPDLIELFREQEHRRRPTNTARSTMSRMGPRAAPAIPSLMVMLEDKDSGVRAASASVLGSIGPEAGIATAPLVEMLKDKEPGARRASAQALGSMGADARTVAGPLISLLNDSSCAHEAVRSLRKLGPDAIRPVLPALIQMLKQEDRRQGHQVMQLACELVWQSEQAPGPSLQTLLNDKSVIVRAEAAVLLYVVDRKTESLAAAALRRVLKEGTSEQRRDTADMIRCLKRRSEAGPELLSVLAEFEAREKGARQAAPGR